MWGKDPLLNNEGALDIRLNFQYKDYFKQDPHPNFFKPVPVQVLFHIFSISAASTNKDIKVISDMTHIAYFLLLRAGEYTGTKSPTNPFQLGNMSLSCGVVNFNTLQPLKSALKTSNYGKLEFTTQKNAILGEVVGHGTSGDALMCPNSALDLRILYLR